MDSVLNEIISSSTAIPKDIIKIQGVEVELPTHITELTEFVAKFNESVKKITPDYSLEIVKEDNRYYLENKSFFVFSVDFVKMTTYKKFFETIYEGYYEMEMFPEDKIPLNITL
nr:hypothetical protein [Abalone asfa-like virus]